MPLTVFPILCFYSKEVLGAIEISNSNSLSMIDL